MTAIAAFGLVFAACGCAGSASADSLTILVSWGGDELTAFNKIVSQFESESGITVNVTSTRALSQEIDADLAEHNLPDLAALPSIGAASQYAYRYYLKPLDNNLVHIGNYGAPWRQLMRTGPGGHVYAVPVKVDIKSLIWYDPAMFHVRGYHAPTTWKQLLMLDKSIEASGGSPWCLAVSSSPTSGWPGTDWVSDIMLSKYGPKVYQEWVSGKLSWTSRQVEWAWETWGRLMTGQTAVYNSLPAALLTNIGSGPYPKPGGCYLQHGTLVDEGFLKEKKREPVRDGPSSLTFGTDYDFFQFPSLGSLHPAIQVSADFMGMFNDTLQARRFISFMTTTHEQKVWVMQQGLDGFSADNQVTAKAYPGMVLQQLAGFLSGHELCFGAGDAMSPALSAAFDQAVLAYLAHPSNSALTTTILPDLKVAGMTNKIHPPEVCGKG